MADVFKLLMAVTGGLEQKIMRKMELAYYLIFRFLSVMLNYHLNRMKDHESR